MSGKRFPLMWRGLSIPPVEDEPDIWCLEIDTSEEFLYVGVSLEKRRTRKGYEIYYSVCVAVGRLEGESEAKTWFEALELALSDLRGELQLHTEAIQQRFPDETVVTLGVTDTLKN